MALVELARLTGRQRYLDQAAVFINRRGYGRLADIELGRGYYQDDIPIRQAQVFSGHAVRALYLASGAVDLAVETEDDELLHAIIKQWKATVARRTYLTLCVEFVDLPGDADVDAIRIDATHEPESRGDTVTVGGALVDSANEQWPYRAGSEPPSSHVQPAEITLRPHHSWAERGPSTMRIWIPHA